LRNLRFFDLILEDYTLHGFELNVVMILIKGSKLFIFYYLLNFIGATVKEILIMFYSTKMVRYNVWY